MGELKYEYCFVKEPFKKIDHYTGTSILAHDGQLNLDCSIGYHCVTSTDWKAEIPHKHDTDQLLLFIGGNPQDVLDFGAVIEFYLGEEREKHIIDKTSVISIPAGLLHLPLIFKKVTKPIVFLEVTLSRKYAKTRVQQ